MPRPYSRFRGDEERAADERRGQALERQLAGEIVGVATSYVDLSGASRVKAVPLTGLARAARSGLGFSPVIDAFTSDGGIDAASPLDTPDGDLRMVPDLDRLAVLPDPEGWAWAPGDRFLQDGTVYAGCQRSFARAQVAAGLSQGISALMAFEVEWMIGRDSDDFQPAVGGTGYGLGCTVGDYDNDGWTCSEAWKRPGCALSRSIPSSARRSSRCRWPPRTRCRRRTPTSWSS